MPTLSIRLIVMSAARDPDGSSVGGSSPAGTICNRSSSLGDVPSVIVRAQFEYRAGSWRNGFDGDRFGFDRSAIAGMEHSNRRPPVRADSYAFMPRPAVLPRACPTAVAAAAPQRSEGTVAARLLEPRAGRLVAAKKALTATSRPTFGDGRCPHERGS